MYKEPEYVMYRNKRIPGWWADYLPEEKNPYQATDTLTLEKGCLSDYWHIHSSNKYPNYKGAEACNFVHDMIYHRFGGTFLSGNYRYGGTRGERSYHEPEHIVYENAYIGEDDKIHIKNAKQYYEDVVNFVQKVLREIAKNHYQSGSSYGGHEFFPFATDAQIEMSRKKAEERKIKEKECYIQLKEHVASEEFYVDKFEYESVKFMANYDYDDGWFNEEFTFSNIKTNVGSDVSEIVMVIDVPHLFYADSKKKNIALATKEMEIPFCFYLRSKAFRNVLITVPTNKVSASIKATICNACNLAMEEYNKGHTELIEEMSRGLGRDYYPYNIFLDNKVGKLKLIYKEDAGRFSWRMRFI